MTKLKKTQALLALTNKNLPLVPPGPFAISMAKYLPCLRKLAGK